jgi:biotin carboxylase
VTHLLVLNGGRDVPARVRELEPGISISVLARASLTHRLPEPHRNRRTVLLPDEATDDDWLQAARWLHDGLPIDRVAVFGDSDQDRWALLAARLGLPGPDPETVEAVRDKAAMRRRLAAAGVCDVPAAVAPDAEAVRAFGTEHGYPLVCKPASGSASRGIARVGSAADAAAAWDRASGVELGSVLVEPFLAGPEYSVEAVSEAGEHLIVAVTQKHKDDRHFVELGHVVPAPLEPGERARVGRAVREALTALGVRDAVTHTEVIAGGDRVRIVETHLRVGGDGIGDLVRAACDVDLTDCQARLALGRPVLEGVRAALARPPRRSAACWFGYSDAAGIVSCVTGIDQARQVAGVRAVEMLTAVGREVCPLTSSFDRTVVARAVAPGAAGALAAARAAVAAVRLEMT